MLFSCGEGEEQSESTPFTGSALCIDDPLLHLHYDDQLPLITHTSVHTIALRSASIESGSLPRRFSLAGNCWTNVITPAANAAGFAVETAEQSGSDVIQSTILHRLLEKDLVIADLSDHNPNVLFELGIRIAKELPVALIKAKGTGRIFDVDNMMRVHEYDPNLWPTTVESDVPRIRDIKSTWDNRGMVRTYIEILTGHRKPTTSTSE